MKNQVIFVLTIFFTLSCNEPRSCVNADLTNEIIILGFNSSKSIEDFNITISEINDSKLPRNIKVNNAFFSTDEYKYLNIELNESLYADNTYQLNLNDDLRYKISDIKIAPKVIMKGMVEDSICYVQSFKVNNKQADKIFSTGINFNKPK